MEAKRPEEPTLLDGLKLLLRKRNCNLGWRIVAKHLFDDEEFATLLEESAKDGARGFLQLIRDKDPNVVRSATGTLRVLRIVRDGRRPKDDAELADLFRKIGVDANKMAADGLKEEIGRDDEPLANPGVKKIQVTATTIQSSKGLAADYVFITHFDDLFFIKDEDKSKVSDQDICGFVVALTRAQKKAFLISSDPRRRPLFLEWIEGTRVEAVPNDIRPATDRDVSAPARRGKGARSRRRSDEVPPSHGAGE
jgi:superfamily I DNA/RNA helicase